MRARTKVVDLGHDLQPLEYFLYIDYLPVRTRTLAVKSIGWSIFIYPELTLLQLSLYTGDYICTLIELHKN